MRHLVPALGQQSTFRVRIHRPWHRHTSPTVGLNSSFAQVVYRQGRQGRGQDREYPLKGCSPRNCGCCLEKQHRKGGETSGRRAAPKPPNKATPKPQRRIKLEPHPYATCTRRHTACRNPPRRPGQRELAQSHGAREGPSARQGRLAGTHTNALAEPGGRPEYL